MRVASLLLGAVFVGGCSIVQRPATSPNAQFSVVVYNRTQAPVFVLAHEVASCWSSRMPIADTLVEGVTPPPGVATAQAVTIKTPRGYTGTVSVVITAGGASSSTVGEIPAASLPTCQGSP